MNNKLLQYNIKTRLKSQGKELKDLYEMLGINKSSYHSRVSGNITIESLNEIAVALGCRVPELLIDPCEQIVLKEDCASDEPVITNLIECPKCGTKMYVQAIKDLK